MTASMRDLQAQAVAKFPVGTKVRHKVDGKEYVVGFHKQRKDGRISFAILSDGGHPKSRHIRAGRLLAEYEVI